MTRITVAGIKAPTGTPKPAANSPCLPARRHARRQLRQVVAWQATTIAGIALLIGLPAGVAAGRWAWRLLAAQLGVLPEPAVPITTILIVIPAALVLANLIAAAPGQAAARTQPAAVLRTE